MIDRAGQKIGNYQLVKLLGHGGFADVYLGEHVYLKTLAAIKVLHTQLANEDVEQFRSEAQTIAHLIHPHIIRVLDFDVDNHTPLLVMDHASNGTLRQLFDRCHGPVSQYTQDSNPQIQNGAEKYSYTIIRSKLSRTYNLSLTLKKDSNNTWHVSDYTSNQPPC